MYGKFTKKIALGLVLGAAWSLSANVASAGEITGNGKEITGHAKSACWFSGLQDDPVGDAGLFRGDRTQNWGQLTEFGLLVFAQIFGITSPSQGCNPSSGGGDAP